MRTAKTRLFLSLSAIIVCSAAVARGEEQEWMTYETQATWAETVVYARAVLAFNDALPTDFSFGFEQVVKDSNIWRSETEKERMWKVAVENELAAVLRQFPGRGVAPPRVLFQALETDGFQIRRHFRIE